MTSEQWEARKAYYQARVGELVLPLDPSPSTIVTLLSKIDALFTEARLDLTSFEISNDDVNRKIYVTEKENCVGKNDVERKRNGVLAVKGFQLQDGTVTDLWELQRVISARYTFMRSVVDILNQKQSRLITLSGVMKLESQLSPHGSIS